MDFSDTLKSVCLKLDIELSEEQVKSFRLFYELLLEYNGMYNLTAIKEENDVIYKHFADSLSVMKFSGCEDIKTINDRMVIDVGTGAGFPGIPLKIVNPDMKLTFIDSVNKKLNFIKEVCKQLNFKNIDIIHGRAEDFGNNSNYREKYDICLSRAVAALPVLSELCIPFVKTSGVFISYKGSDIENEIKSSEHAIKILGGYINGKENFTIPDSDIKRTFIIIRKLNSTPKEYPRKAGVPVKHPL